MNINSFIIDTLINDIYPVPTLIDNGCECLAAVSDSFVRKAKLPRIEINPRKLTEATSCNQENEGMINEMTKMKIDIDGYQRNLYAYIIPRLAHDLILGKPWMEREDVVYYAKYHFMNVREALVNGQALKVWERGFGGKGRTSKMKTSNITNLSAGVFLATLRRMQNCSKNERIRLFTVTLADIQKALAPMKKSSTNLERLPKQYRKYTELFKKEVTDKLPPHRPGSDHQIALINEQDAPWGSLYGMSRDELLVLRKTLTELLDKNYIRASSSPAGAPVLFVRKPGGGATILR